MAKTIITQSGDIVNYSNIAAIYVDTTPIEDDSAVAYGLWAETISDAYLLGSYNSVEDAIIARDRLTNWLQQETYGVYSLAENEGSE